MAKTTRNIYITLETDRAIQQKRDEMRQAAGNPKVPYSAAVIEYVRECGQLKTENEMLKAALEVCRAAKKGAK